MGDISQLVRRKLPETREALSDKFEINGQKGYITVALFEDGKPGELFVTMPNSDQNMGRLIDAWAFSISTGLQYGIPVRDLLKIDENSGLVPFRSVLDYVSYYMNKNFVK